MNLLSQSLKMARGLSTFYRTGMVPDEDFHIWRSLHCRTNGLATDLVNGFITFGAKKPRIGTVSGLAGNLSREQRRSIVADLNRDGVYVFAEPVDLDLVERLRAFAFSHPSEGYPPPATGPTESLFDPEHPISPTCFLKKVDLLEDLAVQEAIADQTLLALAADYLGVEPYLTTVNMWHSSWKWNEPSGPGAQLFHFDLSQFKWLKFFVYLSDVTPDAGPHCFVKGTHHRDAAGLALRRRGPVRIADEDILSVYGKERILEICGPRGTLIALDTRAFHKGIKPRKADRLILELEYSNSTYTLNYKEYRVANPIPQLAARADSYPKTFTRYKVGQLR